MANPQQSLDLFHIAAEQLLGDIHGHVEENGGFVDLRDLSVIAYGITTIYADGINEADIHNEVIVTALRLYDDEVQFFAVPSKRRRTRAKFDPRDPANDSMWYTLNWDESNVFLHNLNSIGNIIAYST